MRHVVRAATLADVDSVAELLRDDPGLKSRSAAGWVWLFRDNPAHRRQNPPPEMGWVLERDGVLDGYVGNVHLDYLLDGKPLRVATCTSHYVRPAAHAEGTRLISAFFRQQGVDVFMTTTACAPDGTAYRLFKAAVPRDASFSEGLVWIAEDRFVLEDLFIQTGVPRAAAQIMGAAGAPVSRLVRSIGGVAHPPRAAAGSNIVTLGPQEIDARFDGLWQRLASAPGLQVRRDAAILRWYFSDPDAGGVPIIFALIDTNEVVGYAAAARHRPSKAALGQVRILDLAAWPDEPSAVRTLLHGVLAYARDARLGLVYCPPCGAPLAAQLKMLRPYARRRKHASHYLRATGEISTANLIGPGVWRATGLDGDTPFGIEYQAD